MCLSTVYETSAPDKALAEYVTGLKVEGDNLTFTDITGNDLTVRGTLANIDLIKNSIMIELA